MPQYRMGYSPEHPKGPNVHEHILIAEKALGHYLPLGAEVHHVNEDKLDNRNCNLVICQDKAYHLFLHANKRALEACGHAFYRKCQYCKEYDSTDRLYMRHHAVFHRECRSAYQRERYVG